MTVKRVSPSEAAKLLEEQGYAYVDVRSPAEFDAGHPEGAYNVPVADPSFLSVMESAFGKDAKIVVGCKMGGRSRKAADALTAAGFTDVIDQRAGFSGVTDPFGKITEPGWAAAGLPVETNAQTGRSFAELKSK